MRIDKLTVHAQSLLAASQSLALQNDNPEIQPLHLLHAMLQQADGITVPLLKKMCVDIQQFTRMVESEVSRLPSASGGRSPTPSHGLQKVLATAQHSADAAKDEFVSTEHLLDALPEVDTKVQSLLQMNGVDAETLRQAIGQVRGSSRVTDPHAESTYQAMEKYGVDLVDMAQQGKLDPVIGRDDEIRRVIQVLSRRTKNNPVLIG
ncbi:MAG: Clp protease N-terminal domain-containing protein, partial [Planctomycetota bacterium]